MTIDRSDIFELEPLLQASELRLLLTEVKPDIRRAGFTEILSDDQAFVGEECSEAFLGGLTRNQTDAESDATETSLSSLSSSSSSSHLSRGKAA